MTDVSPGFRPPCWCPSRWAPTWRLHTNLYKFGKNVSPHIFHKKNSCDLNLGESLCISTFFLFPDSGLNLLNDFDFLFWSIVNGVTLKTTYTAWIISAYLVYDYTNWPRVVCICESLIVPFLGVWRKGKGFCKGTPLNSFIKSIISSDVRMLLSGTCDIKSFCDIKRKLINFTIPPKSRWKPWRSLSSDTHRTAALNNSTSLMQSPSRLTIDCLSSSKNSAVYVGEMFALSLNKMAESLY